MKIFRWLAVLPMAIIAYVIFGYALFLVTYPLAIFAFLGDWVHFLRWLILSMGVAFFSPVWFIMIGVTVAPSHKLMVLYILAICIAAIIGSNPFLDSFMETPPELRKAWWQIALGFAGIIYGTAFAHINYNNAPASTDASYGEEKENGEEAYEFARKAFRPYADTLNEFLLYRVVDEGRLPYKKQLMKISLRLLLETHTDDENMTSIIGEAYCMLAKFQPNATTDETMQRMAMEAWDACAKEDEDASHTEDERLVGLIQARDGVVSEHLCRIVDEEEKALRTELLA